MYIRKKIDLTVYVWSTFFSRAKMITGKRGKRDKAYEKQTYKKYWYMKMKLYI